MTSLTELSAAERTKLDIDGFLALEGIVDRRQIRGMQSRLDELLPVTPQDHAGTMIVSGLHLEPEFDAAWKHPRVLCAIESVLGNSFRLMGTYSRGLRPGHGKQALHTDWATPGNPGKWYLCHAICPLVDFTAENGATRVLPGSHRAPWMIKGHKDLRKRHPSQRQLIGEAGTVFILNVHCLHSAMHNVSRDPRMVVFSSFTRRDSPLLLQSPLPDAGPEVLARHPREIQRLLTN